MENSPSLDRFHRILLLQGSATLAVFAAVIIAVMGLFRSEIRTQILHRDGELLTTVSQHFYQSRVIDDLSLSLIDVALESSELGGVIGVRLFSPQGLLVSRVPADLYDTILGEADLMKLESGVPVVRYHGNFHLDDLFSDFDAVLQEGTYPVTEVLAPLANEGGKPIAIIQYWLDSEEISTELADLDQFLALIATGFLLAGGLIFTLVFTVSRGRLLKMGLLLEERNRSLEKAYADLALAARTSAIGSISSHLFHGLKNPLAGLKAYLKFSGHDEEAMAITERMQNLIDESLAVIRDEQGRHDEILTMEELLESAHQRFDIPDETRLRLSATGSCRIPAQKFKLLLLVLKNLVDNAMEADSNAAVEIRFRATGTSLRVEVEDSGPGLPDQIKRHLFEPVQSKKQNGTGIGLAISAVIARHIPASLELLKSDSDGTTFLINIPQ